MYTDSTLRVIEENQAFTHEDGRKFPWNYPKSEIAGLYKVTETPRPTDASLVVEGFTIDNTHTQVWNTRAKTADELSAELKGLAQSALNASDMVALRCVKADVKFPAEWKAYVADLRAVIKGTSTALPVQPEYPAGT